MFKITVLCAFVASVSAAATCDSYTSEKSCMAASEASDHCSWCSSAAAGKLCLKESDAKTLPSSVFACEYVAAYSAKATAAACDSYTSEKSCMAASEGSDHCSWCSSAAAGKLCLKESDAKTLPSSVFACEYVAAYSATPMLRASVKDDAICFDYTDKNTCMVKTEGTQKCCWCTSAAVSSSCNNQVDAQSLPSSIFHCECPTLMQYLNSLMAAWFQ